MTSLNLSRVAPVVSLFQIAKERDRIDSVNEARIRAWKERYWEVLGWWPNGDVEKHRHVTGQI